MARLWGIRRHAWDGLAARSHVSWLHVVDLRQRRVRGNGLCGLLARPVQQPSGSFAIGWVDARVAAMTQAIKRERLKMTLTPARRSCCAGTEACPRGPHACKRMISLHWLALMRPYTEHKNSVPDDGGAGVATSSVVCAPADCAYMCTTADCARLCTPIEYGCSLTTADTHPEAGVLYAADYSISPVLTSASGRGLGRGLGWGLDRDKRNDCERAKGLTASARAPVPTGSFRTTVTARYARRSFTEACAIDGAVDCGRHMAAVRWPLRCEYVARAISIDGFAS